MFPDPDPVRKCTRCGERPRWSTHGGCVLCRECAGPSEVLRKIGIRSPYLRRRQAWGKRCNVEKRERYARLRAAGVDYVTAAEACKSISGTVRLFEQLRRLEKKTT